MTQGQFKVIRVDGSEETFRIRPTIKLVKAAIGAETLDTVNIGKNPVNGPGTVMLVDDIGSGFIGQQKVGEPKPINEKATALYHSICRPGVTAKIYGDAAICNDEDYFA